ncbi:DNA-binding response regulator [Saccharobesus litoralis]|uniref:DNA-binding response regulator n=1 Tax=Saccharobesus litoralis TaxID=2172099 RepID=A0A2S0VXP0_9ALTE|nr:DNA-binding response regulator [Saccharobesus litoralis]
MNSGACRILIVEDDQQLNQQLSELISAAGYQVDRCFDGEQGLVSAAKQTYDLVLLDVMLPKRDGLSVLSILRKTSQIPVIMLTAKGAEEERIAGLSQGADDYVAKPFSRTELILRIEAILRRSYLAQSASPGQSSNPLNSSVTPHLLAVDELQINRELQTITVGEQALELTHIQYRLLTELVQHKGEVLSKAYLYQRVLRKTLGAHDRSLDMHLSRVRRKLSAAGWRGERLETVHGKGYCLV